MTPEERATVFVGYARRYAELGWTLLKVNGKKPSAHRWQTTRYAAPEETAGRWSRWGAEANIGVLLGPSGLAVVEPDTPAAEAKLLELVGGELPAVPTVKSGGKSLHFYFADDGQGNGARDGLELRADRQQCILPPSVHPDTGRPYVWLADREPWQAEFVPIPDALRRYFAETRRNGPAATVGDEIREPGRHRALLSLAGTMRRRGLGFDEIAAALRTTNELRCKPSLPDAEVVELVADVVRRYRPAPPDLEREQLEREADRLFAAWNAAEEPPAEAGPQAGTRRRQTMPLILSLVEFLGGDEDDATWLVDHLAARGALILIAGLPKVGKSTFVYGLLGALTSERDRFVGLPAGSTWAMLMTEEPPATVEEKVDRFSVDDERVFVISKRRMGAGRSWPKVVADAATFCRAHPEVGVCVIDTWDKFVGLSAKRSEADTGVIVESIEPLYELLGLGVCVILITHQRKEEGEHGLRVRGGTALTGSVDVIVEVERASQAAGLSKQARVLKIVSRFAGAPDEIAVELTESEWRSLGTVKAAARRTRQEDAIALVSDVPKTREELVQAAAGRLSDRTLRRRLDELVKQGLIERLGEGTKGDPYRWLLTKTGRAFVAFKNQGCHESPGFGSTKPFDSWQATGGYSPPAGATNPGGADA